MNILLIGSDSRSGRNGIIGGKGQGQRSDTVMIVHISPRARGITVLSFPRDTVMPIYKCPAEPGGFAGQAAAPGSVEQLNSTFAYGGANCLWNTLEKQTGIHLDNFIQLNFTGFVSVINAIHGVPVCTPVWIRKTHYDRLKLSPGWHVLGGWKALMWWRLREDFGLGSDLQRIQRDQLLMVGMVQGGTQALSRSLFASMIPRHKSSEFFAFFGVFERYAGILGPAIFAWMAAHSGTSRNAILSVLAFFIVEAVLLTFVNVDEGRRAASAASTPATRR